MTVAAWKSVTLEMTGKVLQMSALAVAARTQAEQSPHPAFRERYTTIAESAESLGAVYLAMAEHAHAELAKVTPSTQGEEVPSCAN